MTVYLVDMENIPHAWGKLLESCGEEDRFVLFYTDQISQVPIALMEKATTSKAAVDYVKCHSGPNGLDFQLAAEMGYRIATSASAEYVIVSQDHGFDVLVDYWGERGVRTKRIVPSLSEQGGVFSEYDAGGKSEPQSFDPSDPQSVKDFLYWKLANKAPKKELPFLVEVLLEAMEQGDGYSAERRLSSRFTYVDRALRKRYGDTKGPKIRDQIRSVSREAFTADLHTAAALPEQEESAGPAADGGVLERLSALPASRAGEVSMIVSEVLEGETDRWRAAVYRRLLSAFGRKEGTDLYRLVKEPVERMLSERQETP